MIKLIARESRWNRTIYVKSDGPIYQFPTLTRRNFSYTSIFRNVSGSYPLQRFVHHLIKKIIHLVLRFDVNHWNGDALDRALVHRIHSMTHSLFWIAKLSLLVRNSITTSFHHIFSKLFYDSSFLHTSHDTRYEVWWHCNVHCLSVCERDSER